MVSLRCHNCGHANSPDTTFCSKCASALRRSHADLASVKKVLVPPQDIFQPNIAPSQPRSFRVGWWLIGMMILGGLILWFAYLNG